MDNWVALNGRPAKMRVTQYLIDWDAKSLSKFQKRVKDFLRPHWEKTKIVMEEAPVLGSRMTVDIINVTDHIAIECNGSQHVQYNEWMHDGSQANYRAQLKRDMQKSDWCVRNGLKLVEIFETDMPLTEQWFKDKYDITL